jgi:NADPH2:quinone reductase
MRAAYYEATGPARDVLQLGELPNPEPGPGEVRVRVQWSGVNPSDVKSRAGLRSKLLPFARITPHSDGSGVIDAVGPGVSPSRIGERVWLWNAAWGRAAGTAAELITLPSAQAVRLPEDVSGEAGACLGIPALTALHALLVDGGVDGQTVLLPGGAGAVGHYALQFARRLGAAKIITTVSSPEKAAIARAAGADVVIDYRQEDVAQAVLAATGGRGVDRVLEVDVVANAAQNLQAVRPGGQWVIYGSGAVNFSLPFFALGARHPLIRLIIVYTLSDEDRQRALQTLELFLVEGGLDHRIAARLPLTRIAEAHELVEQGRAIGNVVLAVEPL